MSTTETGISGSSTSRKAHHRRASVSARSITCGTPPQDHTRARSSCSSRAPATLQAGDVLVVHWTAGLPALENVVPADTAIFEPPALVGRVERRRERHIDHVFARLGVEVGWHAQADFFAERHDLAHPHLTQLVVGTALEAVVELLRVPFFRVWQAKPLDGEHEHPVDCALQLGAFGRIRRQATDPLLTMPQVKRLFLVDLGQRTLPRTERSGVV